MRWNWILEGNFKLLLDVTEWLENDDIQHSGLFNFDWNYNCNIVLLLHTGLYIGITVQCRRRHTSVTVIAFRFPVEQIGSDSRYFARAVGCWRYSSVDILLCAFFSIIFSGLHQFLFEIIFSSSFFIFGQDLALSRPSRFVSIYFLCVFPRFRHCLSSLLPFLLLPLAFCPPRTPLRLCRTAPIIAKASTVNTRYKTSHFRAQGSNQ